MKNFKGLKKLIIDNFKEKKFKENKDLIIASIKTRSIDTSTVKDCVKIFHQKKYFLEAVEIINYFLNNIKFDEDFVYLLLDILVSKKTIDNSRKIMPKNSIKYFGRIVLISKPVNKLAIL